MTEQERKEITEYLEEQLPLSVNDLRNGKFSARAFLYITSHEFVAYINSFKGMNRIALYEWGTINMKEVDKIANKILKPLNARLKVIKKIHKRKVKDLGIHLNEWDDN